VAIILINNLQSRNNFSCFVRWRNMKTVQVHNKLWRATYCVVRKMFYLI